MSWHRLSVLALLLGLAALPLPAATLSLVADVNPGTSTFPSYSSGQRVWTALDDRLLFVNLKPVTGSFELWVSDGTDTGTMLLHEPYREEPQLVGASGKVAYFKLSVVANQLWRTDGTRAGTFQLPAPVDSYSVYALSPDALFFTLCPASDRCELWRTDGTPAGTTAILRQLPGVIFGAPGVSVLGRTVFAGGNDGLGGVLFRSDGTAAGTVRVSGLPRFTGSLPNIGNREFLVEASGKVWVWEETSPLPHPFTNLPAGEAVTPLETLAGTAYFLLQETAGGVDLWATDGTAAGTREVAAFGAGLRVADFFPLRMAKLGGGLLFVTGDRSPVLWTSGGTPATTAPLSGCPGGCPVLPNDARLAQTGERVLFPASDPAHGEELWTSDGTGAGTHRVSDLCPGSCDSVPSGLTPLFGQVYFLAQVTENTAAVFRSDGTAAGTERLATVYSAPAGFAPAVAGTQVFWSAAPDSTTGGQLWRSDGTAPGTGLVTLLGVDGPTSQPQDLVALGNRLLWSATPDGLQFGLWTNGGTGGASRLGPSGAATVVGNLAFFTNSEAGQPTLWRTDGTAAGTEELAVFSASVGDRVAFSGALWFTVTDDQGPALWSSDGTAAGTVQRFRLPANVRGIGYLTALGSGLYFGGTGSSGSPSYEALWTSDGTAAGTHLVQSFDQGFSSLEPPQLTQLGSKVFFVVGDTFGGELWRTDGTAAGTASVLPLDDGNQQGRRPTSLTAFAGALYFLGEAEADDSRTGLWRTDGTAAGTVLLKTLGGNEFLPVAPAFFTPLAGQLYFAADDGVHGSELWRTDGTAAGTVLVRDIQPGPGAGAPAFLVAGPGLLYFSADDGEHGAELWQSDGTAEGTRMVQDLAPGALSSSPEELTIVGGQLFLTADDGIFGREVWSYPLASGLPGCQPSATALCLRGGRFQVEAEWHDFNGNSGLGQALPLTGDTGTFWFFDPANIEVIVKVLDGQALNGHFWAFYGALSNVFYTLTVTDTQTGATRRYLNPSGHFGSVGDTQAFGPLGATGSAPATVIAPDAANRSFASAATETRILAPLACVASPTRLCLQGGRFAVEATWRDFQNHTGVGTAVPLTADTGYFWFFDPANVEVVLKVLDGRGLNGHFWVFYGALSNVLYTLTVTDVVTGTVRTYQNPSGHFGSVGDTGAF